MSNKLTWKRIVGQAQRWADTGERKNECGEGVDAKDVLWLCRVVEWVFTFPVQSQVRYSEVYVEAIIARVKDLVDKAKLVQTTKTGRRTKLQTSRDKELLQIVRGAVEYYHSPWGTRAGTLSAASTLEDSSSKKTKADRQVAREELLKLFVQTMKAERISQQFEGGTDGLHAPKEEGRPVSECRYCKKETSETYPVCQNCKHFLTTGQHEEGAISLVTLPEDGRCELCSGHGIDSLTGEVCPDCAGSGWDEG